MFNSVEDQSNGIITPPTKDAPDIKKVVLESGDTHQKSTDMLIELFILIVLVAFVVWAMRG